MRRLSIVILLAISLGNLAQLVYQYPSENNGCAREIYLGVTVPQLYSWLEELKYPSAESWFTAQADFRNSIPHCISGQDQFIQEIGSPLYLASIRYYLVWSRSDPEFRHCQSPRRQHRGA